MEQPKFSDILPLIARGAKEPPTMQEERVEFIPCLQRRTELGSAADGDVVLNDPAVSPCHALLEIRGGAYYLSDAQSAIGTFVNGQSIASVQLFEGDLVQLGPYLFRWHGCRLQWLQQPVTLTLAADHLRQTVGPVTLLDDVGLVCRPGEFVGLLGPSGAGKTTLLNALSGLQPFSAGKVSVNGESLYAAYDRFRHLIGYVPQEDIVHRELSSRQALWYAGRLRLPTLPADQLARRVDETLALLDLDGQAALRVAALSVGQRKRVSVGVELLGQPGILFLDEPTAGLDPGTEARLMRKFRELAHQGRVVICATHIMENVGLLDKLAVLVAGGRLAYFGTPDQARSYFGVDRFADLYERLEEQDPGAWQEQFRRSDRYQELRLELAAERAPASFWRQTSPEPPPQVTLLRQAAALASRFVRTLTGEQQPARLLLLQPALIALLICLVFRSLPAVSFLLVLSALWFGCSLAAQQLVKERSIFRRERMVNLRLDAYLLSKFVPLAAFGAAQCAVMLAVVWLGKRPDWDWSVQLLALAFASWNGVALGLLLSALAANADRATSAIPMLLLPQIILAGVLVALPDMPVGVRAAAQLVAAKWANQAMEIGLLDGRRLDESLLNSEGQLWSLWNHYPAYDLRKPQERLRFLQENNGQTFQRQGLLAVDFTVLGLFVVLLLVAVGVILCRQDAL